MWLFFETPGHVHNPSVLSRRDYELESKLYLKFELILSLTGALVENFLVQVCYFSIFCLILGYRSQLSALTF